MLLKLRQALSLPKSLNSLRATNLKDCACKRSTCQTSPPLQRLYPGCSSLLPHQCLTFTDHFAWLTLHCCCHSLYDKQSGRSTACKHYRDHAQGCKQTTYCVPLSKLPTHTQLLVHATYVTHTSILSLLQYCKKTQDA